MSSPTVGRAAVSYAVFRLGIFLAALVPLTVVLVVVDAPPLAYLGAVAVASVVSAFGALLKGRERRDRLEVALSASRQKRYEERLAYQARVARGPVQSPDEPET